MQAIILAAGKSQRFYPFESFGHKSMVTLSGKPLLQHTLESLKKAKFTDVVIVIGKESTIPDRLQKIDGLSVKFVVQDEALGMGHALSQAREYLHETFFLLSAYHFDVFYFAQAMKDMQKNQSEVVMLAKEDDILERYAVMEFVGNKVTSLVEKPENSSGTTLRAVGIYLLNKSFLAVLDQMPLEHYHFEKALDTYAKDGNVLFLKAEKPTVTLKYSWDLLGIKDQLLSNIKPSISKKSSIAKSAIIEGNVIISDGVRVLEGACIKGPCFLGEGVTVGNNAIVRGGVIAEAGVVIGANMEVKDSILMERVTTHTGYIGDSVIGPATRLAAGFCSANVRFDRKDIFTVVRGVSVSTHRNHFGTIIGEKVDVGINVSTMPGIFLGNNVTVGPATTIMENVEDNSLIYTKIQNTVKKKHA